METQRIRRMRRKKKGRWEHEEKIAYRMVCSVTNGKLKALERDD